MDHAARDVPRGTFLEKGVKLAANWERHATAKEVARVAQLEGRLMRIKKILHACSKERGEIINGVSNRGRYRDQRDAKRSAAIRDISKRIAAE